MGIVIGGKFLWFILTGGSERAFASLLKTVGMLVVALAVLSNIPGTVALLTTLAAALYGTVLEAVRGAAGLRAPWGTRVTPVLVATAVVLLRVLRWLVRALAWLVWRLALLALAALLFAGCLAFPWLRRLAWQTTLMAVGLSLTRRGSFPDPRPGGRRVWEPGNAPERGSCRRRSCARCAPRPWPRRRRRRSATTSTP